MKVAIGSDHGGFELKELLKKTIEDMGHEVKDCGCNSPESTDYPLFAREVAQLVLSGAMERGVLICGTGIGMSMVANRYPGIRAALCHELYTARMSRAHNDANILCIGARVVGAGLAQEMVKIWMETPFEGGRHQRRLSLFNREV